MFACHVNLQPLLVLLLADDISECIECSPEIERRADGSEDASTRRLSIRENTGMDELERNRDRDQASMSVFSQYLQQLMAFKLVLDDHHQARVLH